MPRLLPPPPLQPLARDSCEVLGCADDLRKSAKSCRRKGSARSQRGALHEAQDAVRRVTRLKAPTLLRAAPLRAVLKNMGAVLTGCAGTAEDYDQSQVVTQIDCFVSHNWSTGRFPKFFALALHYNLPLATVAMWTAGLLTAGLTAAELLPAAPISVHFHTTGTYPVNSVTIGYATFAVCLCFGNDIRHLLRLGGPWVFLDKLCIHQTSEELKRDGIAGLAAFMRVSERMLIVYTDTYLRKLWTVYEVASFLTLRGDSSRIVIMPAAQMRRMASMMAFILFTLVGCRVPGLTNPEDKSHKVSAMVFGPLLTLVQMSVFLLTVRLWKREVHRMECAMKLFEIRRAACFVESDRKLVQDNVCAFMKHLGKVQPKATEDEALNAFDALVHNDLPPAIQSSFGRNVLTYRFLVAMTAGFLLEGLDLAAARLAQGLEWYVVVAPVLSGIAVCFAIVPICYSIMGTAMGGRMDLHGWSEVCHIAKWAVFLCPLCLLYVPLHIKLILSSLWDGDMAKIGCMSLAAYVALLVLPVLWLYRPLEVVADMRENPTARTSGVATRDAI